MSGFTPYENSEDDNIDNIEGTHLMRNVGEIIFPSSSINPLIAPTSRTRQGGEDDYHEDVHRTQPQYPNPYQSINVIQPSSTQPNQFQSYTIRHSHSFSSDKSTTSMSSGQQSPFFRPSTPRELLYVHLFDSKLIHCTNSIYKNICYCFQGPSLSPILCQHLMGHMCLDRKRKD